ncbi:hypothetical protein SpCBS45565_g04942 [Spizellomyces sp. 'palustris']|nr:hypothetical protein SpCBS45565_g04942 [Spizellomyces sp. 'palustris']
MTPEEQQHDEQELLQQKIEHHDYTHDEQDQQPSSQHMQQQSHAGHRGSISESVVSAVSSPALSHATVPSNAPSANPTAADSSAAELLDRLKLFLATAPTNWDPEQTIKRFALPNGEHISCVLWNNLFHITGTDIVRSLMFRFQGFGRPVKNVKKFEEGVFSDLRNLKPGIDATLEEPRSEFLEMLYKNNCIRTQKKQKVFYWFSVPHDRLFMDALERDLKREALGIEPTTVAINPMPLIPTLELAKQQCLPTLHLKPDPMSGPGESTVVLDEWINDSPIGAAPAPPQEGPNGYVFNPMNSSPHSAAGTPYLTHASPQMSTGNSPSMSSVTSEDGVHGLHTAEGEYIVPQQPGAGNPGMFGVFSLFEGSPNYKQRRRAQSLFSLSKGYNSGRVSTPEPVTSSPLRSKEGEEKRNYVCTFDSCGRKFKRYEHLRRHMRCHTGEKPYVCPIENCAKGFSRSDNLSQHMKIHGGQFSGKAGSPAPSLPGMDYGPEMHTHSMPASPMMHANGSPMMHQSHTSLHQRSHSLPASPMLHNLSHAQMPTMAAHHQQHPQGLIQLPHPQQHTHYNLPQAAPMTMAYLPHPYAMHPQGMEIQHIHPAAAAAMQGHLFGVTPQHIQQMNGSSPNQPMSGFAF